MNVCITLYGFASQEFLVALSVCLDLFYLLLQIKDCLGDACNICAVLPHCTLQATHPFGMLNRFQLVLLLGFLFHTLYYGIGLLLHDLFHLPYFFMDSIHALLYLLANPLFHLLLHSLLNIIAFSHFLTQIFHFFF